MEMHPINNNKIEYLRSKAITGAIKYKQYLIDKDFCVICEDYSEYIVRFYANDFKHLTGIISNLSNGDFFNNCCNLTLSNGNIDSIQKYNWQTLRNKAMRIENIEKIMYGNSQNSLFLVNLHTNTATFPFAIRNSDADMCIGFTTENNKARTLRKYSSSNDADIEKEIIAIFAKDSNIEKYSEKVFLKKDVNLKDRQEITIKLSDDLNNII